MLHINVVYLTTLTYIIKHNNVDARKDEEWFLQNYIGTVLIFIN